MSRTAARGCIEAPATLSENCLGLRSGETPTVLRRIRVCATKQETHTKRCDIAVAAQLTWITKGASGVSDNTFIQTLIRV